MPLSLTPIDVNPTSVTAMPAPAAIPSHASVATIPARVTAGTNNVYEINSLDIILNIIDMGSPTASTVDLSSFCDTIHNSLLRVQGYM